MSHAKPRLSAYSRLLICQRVAAGRPAAHVAKEMGVSRPTVHKWLRRYREEGVAGLQDRSSRPHRCPHRLAARVERRIVAERVRRRVGAARLARELGLNPSTVGRVLGRHRVPLLGWLDPTTGVLIRGRRSSAARYEYDAPGGLIHVDVKKIGRIPAGGGWRVHGRAAAADTAAHKKARTGYDYVHAAVDDHSRLAYAEILADERGPTCAAFLTRALRFFAAHAVTVERVMTDNAFAYRHSHDWREICDQWGLRHVFTRPHCPWTNGKVERFNRTLQVEWAYRKPWTSNTQRHQALARWLRHYNHRRPHTALDGLPPISRLSTT